MARTPRTRRFLPATPWWVLLFFVVGVGATLATGVGLFLSAGRRPPIYGAPHLGAVTADDFLKAVGGATDTSVHAGGTVALLNNGEQFYPAIVDAIRSARRSVTFLVYIWEAGEISTRLFDALVERAGAGVEIRLLLDGFGGVLAPTDRVQELQAVGGKVARYRPPRFGLLTRFHRRNHRRAIVIDGTVAFTGGAAVGDKWKGSASNPQEWRDSMVRVTGPLAHSLQRAFAQSWTSATGEVLAGPAFFPAADRLPSSAGPSGLRHVSVASSPAPEAHPLRTLYWVSFRAARERLFIASSYFVPDEHLRGAVIDRARAGVDVRLLLPGEHTDAKPIQWASHSYFEELLAAGVRIYEYRPTFMHAKHVVVDGAWVVVGSANMDVRSKELNEENVLGILDAPLAAQVERSFFADIERSNEIRLEDWRKRGWGQRILERVSVLLEEQF
jgi:cardiolipin synthase